MCGVLAPGLLHIPVFKALAPPFSRIISGAGWTLDGAVDFSLSTAGVECLPCRGRGEMYFKFPQFRYNLKCVYWGQIPWQFVEAILVQ